MLNSAINAGIAYIMTANKLLINIIGPTAIGKTALSIKLAQHFKSEIVSSDSRQFYKEMSIGTAVPTTEELNSVKHHFIHNLSITDQYSVGQFEKDALELLEQLFKTHNIVIMVGGSGLYSKAVISGFDEFPDIDKTVRQNLNKDLKDKGLEYLQKQLQSIDPIGYKDMDIHNPQRLIRALEVSLGTGKPYSSFKTSTSKQRFFQVINIGLSAERSELYDRINKRVDLMVSRGLLKEAKSLIQYRDLNPLNTVGYKELFEFFDGKYDLDFAISEIKKNTRRFAKRQLTWYRKDKSIHWFHYQDELSNMLSFIESENKNLHLIK